MNASQTVLWRWDSDAFGVGAANSDPDGDGSSFTFNQRFPGQYYDTETGLHYNYFRDYDPSLGRYVQSDPIGLDGGSNLYLYGNANPMTFTDPLGLEATFGDILGSGARGAARGGAIGSRGGATGAIAGAVIGAGAAAIYEACKDDSCPPCTPYAEGRIGYQGPEVHERGRYAGQDHLHIFVVNQRKSDCKCFWNPANKKLYGHQYFGPIESDWINLNGSNRPPNYPH